MSLYIDQKYVSLISVKLDQFKIKKNYIWNFRCPICGDSKKNKTKARAYVYRQKSNLSFVCHNCGHSCSFGNFLKTIDPALFKEYQLERYKNESAGNVTKPDFEIARGLPVFTKNINIPTIESLDDNHSAKKYIASRKIPNKYWSQLYYADDFKQFIITTFTEHDQSRLKDNDARIVIPFFDRDKKLLGVQGRAIGVSKVRYITIKQNEDCKKIFGLDRLDLSKKVYVTEGPIDSLFLKNSVATMDANLSSVADTIKTNFVLVFDNEPRNKEIVKQMKRAIDKKYAICIWPSTIEQKDINDMIMAGYTKEQLEYIIDQNTFTDLKAQMQFNMWRKV
jgi:predicted RNA-binding Zn-ribbon protein involved in translation (DUF1610 family)